MKKLLLLLMALPFSGLPEAQPAGCTFKPPFATINFGTGDIRDLNTDMLYQYDRVSGSCPTDGHYVYTPATSYCFSGDWLTLTEDHTPGDADGNMLIVNASHQSGVFLSTRVKGFKGGATYEFAAWLMNVCRISDKCPYPLLPNITIRLQTLSGKSVAQFNTGDIPRLHAPHWTRHRAVFTVPAGVSDLQLIMTDNRPGGCGNDFALDDITFRECVITPPVVSAAAKPAVSARPKPEAKKPEVKKEEPAPVKRPEKIQTIAKGEANSPAPTLPVVRKAPALPPPPAILTTRTNPLVRQIETAPGELVLNLYDNGEIDGDTVSIYHNNTLLVSHARLSAKPISFRITVDAAQPYHELVMVAENLGSIPPNTSVLIVTAGTQRHQVFITSTEQKNAKVLLRLKE